jgi:hypothetical protein
LSAYLLFDTENFSGILGTEEVSADRSRVDVQRVEMNERTVEDEKVRVVREDREGARAPAETRDF